MATTLPQVWKTLLGRASKIVVVLTACYVPIAFAYDSAGLADALESLTTESFPQWEAKARSGDAVAQDVVGMAYKYGDVTVQDHAKSLHWFLQAAGHGDADAQFNLGRIYGKATGFVYEKKRAAPRDDITAANWYRKAAEQEYAPAQYNLAQMYVEGSQSVARDVVQAFFWLQQASRAGDRNASTELAKIDRQLGSADKENVQRLATEWAQRHRK